jgi:TATA-box binding protein (TBP) (component of TFIID and TFIIIB)
LIRIVNVITTGDLLQPIEIEKFNKYQWGRFDLQGNYNGKVGNVKDKQMEGRVTVFSSGKLISTGAKSVKQSIQQLKQTMILLLRIIL